MATTVTVFESAARRAGIKVTPGTYLHEVREQACTKFRLDPDKYGLKHNNKTIDISSQFRLSGLPSGAKLELVQLSRSAGVVTVALQLPAADATGATNGRLVEKFPSTTTLWQVLRKLEDGAAGDTGKRNLTARGVPRTTSGDAGAGRLYYEQPVMTVVNRDYGTFVELQKTLSALGLSSGNVLIKLSYRSSGQPLEEAQEQMGRYFEEVEGSRKEIEDSRTTEAPSASSLPENQASHTPVSLKPTLANHAATPADTTSAETDEPLPVPIEGVTERPITVYSAPTHSSPQAATAAHDPSDYEFTIDHAKTQAAMYQAAGRNKPLPSDAEIEAKKAEAAAKLAAIHSIQIKVRFPDQTSVVSEFTDTDTGSGLYSWVRGLMQHGDAAFTLRWASQKGMKDVPDDSKRLIQDIGLTGRVQVTLTWKEGASIEVRRAPILKDRVAEVAQELQVKGLPDPAQSKTTRPAPSDDGSAQQPEDGQGEVKKKQKMPAWLKKSLPGKK